MSKKIGTNLSDILRKKGVSLYKLSKKSKVDYAHVHRIAHDKSSPSQDVLRKLCGGLECSNDEVVALFHAAGYLAPSEV